MLIYIYAYSLANALLSKLRIELIFHSVRVKLPSDVMGAGINDEAESPKYRIIVRCISDCPDKTAGFTATWAVGFVLFAR